MTIKAGNVVRLKSGGPLMTVNTVHNNIDCKNEIRCVWFVENQLYRDAFFEQAVETSGPNNTELKEDGTDVWLHRRGFKETEK